MRFLESNKALTTVFKDCMDLGIRIMIYGVGGQCSDLYSALKALDAQIFEYTP